MLLPLSTWTSLAAGTSAHLLSSDEASGIDRNKIKSGPNNPMWCSQPKVTLYLHTLWKWFFLNLFYWRDLISMKTLCRLLVCSSEGFLHLYSLDQVTFPHCILFRDKIQFLFIKFNLNPTRLIIIFIITRLRAETALWFASFPSQKRSVTSNLS